MGITKFRGILDRQRIIALDTSIFIYHIELHPKYLPLTEALFKWLSRGGNSAVTSTISLTELLVPGYRDGDQSRVDTFFLLLTTFPGLVWCPATVQIADLAAKLRAACRMKTPDAIQAATAVQSSATAFITNDPIFKRVTEFATVLLDDLL